MERTPSKERQIPIEIIGQIGEVSEDEIDIDNFVENINAKINKSKPPKGDKVQNDLEKSSSNRASLIITHEDGSTEENECTVTCLGISSDSAGDHGLQIEEISQDTLKDKLAEEKLKVIIPDMSQVIILESDEVTDASFVSTPEVEEASLSYEKVLDMEDTSTPTSSTPIPCIIVQEDFEDTNQTTEEEEHMDKIETITVNSIEDILIQDKAETKAENKRFIENSDDQIKPAENYIKTLNREENTELIDNVQSPESVCGADLNNVDTLTPKEEKESFEPSTDVEIQINTQEIKETLAQCENTSPKENVEQNTKTYTRKQSSEDFKVLESRKIMSTDSETVYSENKEIHEIEIKLDDREDSNREHAVSTIREDSLQTDNSEQIKCNEPLNRYDLNLESKSKQISADKAEDQNKLGQMKAIAETVRIIPITLPDGRFVERGVVSDDRVCSEQSSHTVGGEQVQHKTDSISNISNEYERSIPIQIESKEIFETSKQETKQDAEYGKTDDEKVEEQSNHAESFSQSQTIKTSNSIKNLSETSNLNICRDTYSEKVESSEMINSCLNRTIFDSDQRILSSNQIQHTSKLPEENDQEKPKDVIAQESIKKDAVKDRLVQIQMSDLPNSEPSNITINTAKDDCESLDKNKQTEATRQANTCSDALDSHLSETKEVENERIRNIPIQIEATIEGESECKLKNENSDSEDINKEGELDHENHSRKNSNFYTESVSSHVTKVSSEELKYQNDKLIASQSSSESNGKQRPISFIDTEERIPIACIDEINDYESTEFDKKEEQTQKDTSPRPAFQKPVENKTVRNIPIQMQTNTEVDSESDRTKDIPTPVKDNNSNGINQDSNQQSMRKNSWIRSEIPKDADKDQVTQSHNASPQPTSPPVVCRTVPIQIMSCEDENSDEQERQLNMDQKQSNSQQIERSIPIQRVVENSSQDSTGLNKNIIKEDDVKISKDATVTKSDNLKMKDTLNTQMKEIKPPPKLPSKPPPAVASVPIHIQLLNETLNNFEAKESSSDNKMTDKKCTFTDENPKLANKIHSEKSSTYRPAPPIPTTKPPAVVRTIPILRQSLSDSGAGMGRQQTSARQRNVSEQSTRGDILQKVHADLEEARVKLAAQANSLSSGLENLPSKGDPRSRSVEAEQRNQEARSKETKPRTLFKRERSLQDIDKDIETIWRELQELDKPDMANEINPERTSRNSNRSQTPLSEQVLVTPSWRSPTPPPQTRSVRTSLSNPNISNNNVSRHSLQSATAPHTIWDPQPAQEPKYEPTNPSQLSSSWDSKPQYFPPKSSTHFGFLPKPDTKPGSITPSYSNQNLKAVNTPVRNVPIQTFEAAATKKSEPTVKKETESQNVSIESKHSSKVFKSEESLKSCLKSETSSFSIQPIKTRSQSPSNVKFANKMKTKSKGENTPKAGKGSSEPDPPFEWVDFRKADGEIVKGTILPPLHRDDDVIIARDVPIINVLLDDAMKEEPIPVEKLIRPTIKEREIRIESPSKGNAAKKDDAFNACDMGTQTEKAEKKSGCRLM